MSTSTVAICTHAAPTSMSRPYSAMLPASFTIICRNYIMRPGLCQAGFIGARRARATQGGAVAVRLSSGSCARDLLTNPQRYCAPLISSRTNLIRISITLLCAHWQLHSRPNQHTSPHYRVCPTIGNRTNLIRISIKLLCAHRRSHSRPISTPRLITASARPSVAARRFDLASLQRYCAPLISSRTNPIRMPMTLLCVHRRSQSRLISTPRLITASARPPVAAQT